MWATSTMHSRRTQPGAEACNEGTSPPPPEWGGAMGCPVGSVGDGSRQESGHSRGTSRRHARSATLALKRSCSWALGAERPACYRRWARSAQPGGRGHPMEHLRRADPCVPCCAGSSQFINSWGGAVHPSGMLEWLAFGPRTRAGAGHNPEHDYLKRMARSLRPAVVGILGAQTPPTPPAS